MIVIKATSFPNLAPNLWVILLGISTVFAFAPYYIFPILFFLFPALFLKFSRAKTWKIAFKVGFLFGFSYYAAHLPALMGSYVHSHVYSLLTAILALIYVPLWPLGVGIINGLVFAGAWLVPVQGFRQLVVFSVFFGASFWVAGHVIPFVPVPGYCWGFSNALLQGTAYFGIYGLTYLTILVCSAPALLWLYPRKKAVILTFSLVFLFPILYRMGILRLSQPETGVAQGAYLRLVQSDFTAEGKQKDTLDKLVALSSSPQPQKITHIIWPESAFGRFFMEGGNLDPDYRKNHTFFTPISQVTPPGGALIFGIMRGVFKKTPDNKGQIFQGKDGPYFFFKDVDKVFNSMLIVNNHSTILGIYDKKDLIPFSESNPFHSSPFFPNFLNTLIEYTLGDYLSSSPGEGRKTIKIEGLPGFSPLICYEGILSGDVVAKDQPRPDWLLVISNDSWFRGTHITHEHLAMVRVRSIEEGLPIIRVANAGISAVIDPYGRILKSLPANSEGVIDTSLPLPLRDLTLFARYGDWGLFVLLMISCFGVIRFRKLDNKKG